MTVPDDGGGGIHMLKVRKKTTTAAKVVKVTGKSMTLEIPSNFRGTISIKVVEAQKSTVSKAKKSK
jgi:hypothetical protein